MDARGFALEAARLPLYRLWRIVPEGTHCMTDFKDRERAEEAHFALEGETAFRIAARRKFRIEDLEAQTLGVECRKDGGVNILPQPLRGELAAALRGLDQG